MIIQSVTQINSFSRSRYLIIAEIIKQNLKHSFKHSTNRHSAKLIAVTLSATYLAVVWPTRFFFRIDSTIHEELKSLPRDNRYMIVANHKARIDPYLILATLPFKSILTLVPIRFFTANQYLQRWWQRSLLGIFGSFRAYSTEGKTSGIHGGLHFSDKGQSLLIFPQGKRVRGSLNGELKVGVGYMAQQRNFTILPVYISDVKGRPGRRTHIRWGKPFTVDQEMIAQELPELTKNIFSSVIKLSKKH